METATLTITSPYKQDFLSDAIIRYELEKPGEKIKYDYEYNTREEFINNAEQYGKKLTTKIFTGDIGDIVMTGGAQLIYRQIFLTDVFIDLTDFIKKDDNYNSLNKSVIDGIRINNKIKGLPISAVHQYYEINLTLADELDIELDYNEVKWSEILELVYDIEQKSPDSYLFLGDKESILVSILISNMPQLIDFENKKIDLNQEWFVSLLKNYKLASDSNNFNQTNYEFDMFDNLHDSLFVISTTGKYSYNDISAQYKTYNEKYGKNLYIPLFAGEKESNRVAYTNNMYSINSKSKNIDKAWKFLSFLLEDSNQSIKSLPGKPINILTEEILLENSAKKYIDVKETSEIFIGMMKNISSNVDYMYDYDHFNKDLADPIMEYINDKITLEKALEKAEKNAFIRLNE